jgi:hypothetical protein
MIGTDVCQLQSDQQYALEVIDSGFSTSKAVGRVCNLGSPRRSTTVMQQRVKMVRMLR